MNAGILWLIAPAAMIGAVIFFFVYEQNTENQDIQRAKMELQQSKFDKDFATAWNTGTVELKDDVASKKMKLEQIEKDAERKKTERKNQINEFKNKLSVELED